MIQALGFLLTIITFFAIPAVQLSAAMQNNVEQAVTPAIKMPAANKAMPVLNDPNITVDLNPQGTKTVIPPKPKPATTKEEANIFLNFENASLESLLNYLAEEKKINVLPYKGLADAKVSLSTRKPLTLERAWNVLLTILEMNNFTINEVGGLYRVVEGKQNGKEPLPTYVSKTTLPENLPDTNQVVRYVYFLSNLKTEVANGILTTMLEEGSVQVNQDLQACILKEKCMNIKAAMKIVKELDLGGMRESIKIIPLQEADVTMLAKLLQEIIGTEEKEKSLRFSAMGKKKESTYFSSSTKVIPYPARNALILLGDEKNINKIVNFIYKYLDVPIGSAESRIHIKEVRYAQAKDLKPIIEKIIRPPTGQGTDKSSVVGRYKFFEDVNVVAEEESTAEGRGSGNRLIISCNKEDWIRLEDFIDSLDKPQPQVAIEVMIVNLQEDQSKSLGTQLQSKEGKEVGMGINRAEFNNLAVQSATRTDDPATVSANPDAIPMQNYMATAASIAAAGAPLMISLGTIKPSGTNNIWALIQSTFNISNSQVIGQPYIIANNHQKDCTIELKETRRLDGPLVQTQGVQRKTQESVDAGTKVVVTPQINSEGIVDLLLEIKIDQFDTNSDTAPDVIRRSIKTKSTMATGEVLVLGGFKVSDQKITLYKTPLLGDIPIIGNFFKSKKKTKTEQYLYLFIRPSIIKPQFEGAPDEYTQLKLDYSKYQMLKNDAYAKDKDPIQRWFFKPTNYTISQKLNESRLGIFAPIDDFAEAKGQPKSVNIKEDPYFKVSEAITKERQQIQQRKIQQRKGHEKIGA